MSLQQQEQQQLPRQRRRSTHENIRDLFSDAAGVSAGRRPTFIDNSTTSSTGSAANVDSLLCGGEQEAKLQIRETEVSGATVAKPVTTDVVASTPPPSCPSNSSSHGSSIDRPLTSMSICTAAESSSTTPPDLQLGLDLNANNTVSRRTNNIIEGLGQEFTMPLARPAYTTIDPLPRATTRTSSSSSSRRRCLHDALTFQDRRQRHVEFYLACVDESFFLDDDDSCDHDESDNDDSIGGGRRREKEDFERRRHLTQRNEHHMAIDDVLLWLKEEESGSETDEDSIA